MENEESSAFYIFGTDLLGSCSRSRRLTLTLLSRGRGSGASNAPISTRQVEGRRTSMAAPAPLPLPADISEPPLSATQLCQRLQHRAAQPSRPAHCAARADATLTAAQCGREAPLYLERGKQQERGASAQAPAPGALTGAVASSAIPRLLRELQQKHRLVRAEQREYCSRRARRELTCTRRTRRAAICRECRRSASSVVWAQRSRLPPMPCPRHSLALLPVQSSTFIAYRKMFLFRDCCVRNVHKTYTTVFDSHLGNKRPFI